MKNSQYDNRTTQKYHSICLQVHIIKENDRKPQQKSMY